MVALGVKSVIDSCEPKSTDIGSTVEVDPGVVCVPKNITCLSLGDIVIKLDCVGAFANKVALVFLGLINAEVSKKKVLPPTIVANISSPKLSICQILGVAVITPVGLAVFQVENPQAPAPHPLPITVESVPIFI